MQEKSELLQARVRPDEKRVFVALCRHERRNQSEMLRELLREGAERRGLWPPAGSGRAAGVRR